MAQLVGCVAMSHAPQVMIDPDNWDKINVPRNHGPLAPELLNMDLATKWERWRKCMDAVQQMREAIEAAAPDTLIIVGDDQNENLRPDAMPAFTVFIGDEADASWSLKYLGQTSDQNRPRYRVDRELGEWVDRRTDEHVVRSCVLAGNALRGGSGTRFRPRPEAPDSGRRLRGPAHHG